MIRLDHHQGLRVLDKLKCEGLRDFSRTVLAFLQYHVKTSLFKDRVVVRDINGYRMSFDLQVRGISKTLFVYGVHEVLETELVKEILFPSMTVLDVGANIGYYALLEASLVGAGGLVYALEPFPRNYRTLGRNIALNGYQGRIRMFNIAAGDRNGTSKMFLGPADNMHCLMDYKRKDTYLEYIEVETVTLDRFLEDKKRIDFLRMDLEGFECQVIDGMRRTLETQGPNILFEIHPLGEIDPDPRYTPYLDYLMTLGYRPKTLVCPARRETLVRFGELGYRPQKTEYNGMVKSVRFDDIRPEDLIKVAARRPKITRAIYLARE